MATQHLTLIPPATAGSIGLGGSDANKHHQVVMGLFADDLSPNGSPRAEANILFRRGPDGSVLVRSDISPVTTPVGATTLATAPARFNNGDRVRFEVAFNNVTRHGDKATPAEPTALLRRRLEGILEHIEVDSASTQVRRRKGAALSVAHINGVATVKDADALAAVCDRGLGRGRAYGCGLLTLSPA